MQLIAHVTMLEFAAGIVIFLTGVCVGPWLVYVMSSRKGKDIRAALSTSVADAEKSSVKL